MNTVQRGAADLGERVMETPESLRGWITEIGHIPTVTDVSAPFTHAPHTATTIVLRREPAGARALVLGPQTRATYTRTDRPAGCTRLRLAPGATRELLGVRAVDLADRVVPLAELPGPAADLGPELLELDPAEVLPFLSEVLPRRLTDDPVRRAHRRLLRRAVASLSTAPTPVPALAAELAVSERQLRNLFIDGVGVSPKHFARIDRVRTVLAHAGTTPWAELAGATGYYDQSHLTADFRTLMGVPPAQFVRGHLPAPTPCRAPG
ncbi:helix-turn-helix domain-containing protein [Nocardia sp. NPDC127579]|uniref:AraC family transcriptional regulator n=1 Tax=Nocardia sp. NPDC127579 TaxID=3345402 RepID=UPI0036422594